jgi:ferrous iron transport protein A
MDLDEAPVGVRLRILDTSGPGQARLRLAELGIRPGEDVLVIQRTAGGGRILGVGDCRIAVDRPTARSITIEHVPAADSAPPP